VFAHLFDGVAHVDAEPVVDRLVADAEAEHHAPARDFLYGERCRGGYDGVARVDVGYPRRHVYFRGLFGEDLGVREPVPRRNLRRKYGLETRVFGYPGKLPQLGDAGPPGRRCSCNPRHFIPPLCVLARRADSPAATDADTT